VLLSAVGGLPSLLPTLLRDLACSTTSIALRLFGFPGPRALSSGSPEGWLLKGGGSLVSLKNAAMSLVLSRLRLRASRGAMDEFEVDGRRAGTLPVRGGTLLVRGALARSMRDGDTGVGRGCSYLRSIGTGCASNSTAPLVLIGALGRGLSTDRALILWPSLLYLERGMADTGGCAEAALPWDLVRLLAAAAIRAISLITVESWSRLSLRSCALFCSSLRQCFQPCSFPRIAFRTASRSCFSPGHSSDTALR
jgi:hypothetical protein